MILNLCIYFVVGVVQDFLWTLNVKYVSDHKILAATITSFLTTAVSMVVLYNILTRLDSERSLVAIIVYSLGIAVGTILGMKSHGGIIKKP